MVSAVDAYPAELRSEVRHAARFAYTLATITARLPAGDPHLVWLTGRADEIAAFVGGAVREWSEGRLDAASAGEVIGEYLDTLHLAVRRRFGPRRIPPCCGAVHDDDERESQTITRQVDIAAPRFQPRTDTIPAPPMR